MAAKLNFYETEGHNRFIQKAKYDINSHKFVGKFNRLLELGLIKNRNIASYLDKSNDTVIIYNLMIATMFTDNDFTPPERSTNMEVAIDKLISEVPDVNKIIF